MTYDSHLYACPPLVSSAELAWRGLRVEHYQLDAMALPTHYHQHHLLIIHEPGVNPVTARRQQGGRTQETTFSAGDLGLYPGGEYGPIAWNGPTNTIHLYVDDQHLENLARQTVEPSHFKLNDQLQFRDALLRQLGRHLFQAIGATHAMGLLYIESLTNAFCYHLIEHYTTWQRRISEGRRLPTAVLSRIDAYLETHADAVQPVTLETLAELANLSVFYFSRLFKKTTGMSPYQYVVAWKIRRAKQLLRTDTPITAVSDALGFASPAHFSAVFKRALGVSPSDFRQG